MKGKSNPVAKHLRTFNKATVERDRKKDSKRGKAKYKKDVYKEEETQFEDLRKWFGKGAKGDWVRVGTDGEIKGDCAKDEGEGKPKCMPRSKANKTSLKDRASAARRKRYADPVADRQGKGGEPIMVKTDKKESIEEKNVPTSPELCSKFKSQAKAKFDVYPSAYANGWAAKQYKAAGGGWKTVSESVNESTDKLISSYVRGDINIKTVRRGTSMSSPIFVKVTDGKKTHEMGPYKSAAQAKTAVNKMHPAPKGKRTMESIDEGLSDAQIETLRKQYATLKTVNPTGAAWKKVTKFLEARTAKELEGIALAKIKFISQTASDMLKRKHGVKLKFSDTFAESVEFNEAYIDLLEAVPPINMLMPGLIDGSKTYQQAGKEIVKDAWRALTGKQKRVVAKVHKLTQSDDELGKLYRDGWKSGGTSMKPGARKAFDARVKELMPNEESRDYIAAWKSVKAKVQSAMKDQRNESVEQVDEKVVPYNKELLARMIELVQMYFSPGNYEYTDDDYKKAMSVIKKIAGPKVAAEVSSKKATDKVHFGRANKVSGHDIMRDRQGLSGRKKTKSGKLSKVSMSQFKKDVEDAVSKHQKVTRKLPESVEQVEEGRKLNLTIDKKWSKKEVNREIKDTTQEIKMGQAAHKKRPMNDQQADHHWERKNHLVALVKHRKTVKEDNDDAEQVDELSNKLLKRYDRKATTSATNLRKKMMKTADTVRKSGSGTATPKQAARFTKAMDKHSNRMDGLDRAQQSRLKKDQTEEVMKEGKIPSNYGAMAARAKKKAFMAKQKAAKAAAAKPKTTYNYATHSTGVQSNGKKETKVVKHGTDATAADAAHKKISSNQFSRHVLVRKAVKESVEQVDEALSNVVVKKMQDMVGGPKNMPRGDELRALKAKAKAAVAAEKKSKKAAPKAKTTTKTAKGKTHKGSADASDRNIIMQLRIAQDSMNHGDKTGDVRVSPTRTANLSKAKIDALLKKHDALQKPDDKRKFVVLMTKALRKA